MSLLVFFGSLCVRANLRSVIITSTCTHTNVMVVINVFVGARGQVDRALDSRSEGLGFDPQCWLCVEVSGKLRIPHCLGPPSRNGYLVHRSKVGSIVAGCRRRPLPGGRYSLRNMLNVDIWTLNRYLYLLCSFTTRHGRIGSCYFLQCHLALDIQPHVDKSQI